MAHNPRSMGAARYVFSVEFRLEPETEGLSLSPARFRTTLYRQADPPGSPGWLFFRDHLWHGELSEPDHFRTLSAEGLGVQVTSVTFRELQTDEGYLESLKAEMDATLDEFRADSVDRALSKYLGSSIRVVPPGGPEGS